MAEAAISWEDLKLKLADAPPPTHDEVTILQDGRRLDSKEKVLAWLVEIGRMTPEEAAEF